MSSFSPSKDSHDRSSGGHRGHSEISNAGRVYAHQSFQQYQSTETRTRGVTTSQDVAGTYGPSAPKKSTDQGETRNEDSDEDDFVHVAPLAESKGKGRMPGERNEKFQIHSPQRIFSNNAQATMGESNEERKTRLRPIGPSNERFVRMYSADGRLSRLVHNPAYIAPVDERSVSPTEPEDPHTYPPRRSYDDEPASTADINQAIYGKFHPIQHYKPAKTTTPPQTQNLEDISSHYAGRRERSFLGLGFGGLV